MHGIEIGNLLINLVMVSIAMITIVWGFYRFIDGKLEKDRAESSEKIINIYKRMDEKGRALESKIDFNHDLVHKDFVTLKVHELDKQNNRERSDEKFKHLLELFEIQFKQLSEDIKSLRDKGDKK